MIRRRAKFISEKKLDATHSAEPTTQTMAPVKRGIVFKLVDRYLFAQVLEATLRGLAMFVMLLLVFAIISATNTMLANSLSLYGALLMIFYQMPRLFLFTLPMAILYGTLQAISEMSTHGEITALWGGGMSFLRLLRAPLVLGVVLAIFAFGVQEMAVPNAETRKVEVLSEQLANSTSVQKDLDFASENADGSSLRITADEYNARTKTLLNPVVTRRNSKRETELEITADKAQWDTQNQQWSFINGHSKDWNDMTKTGDAESTTGRSGKVVFKGASPQLLRGGDVTREQNLLKLNYEFVSLLDLEAWRHELDRRARDTRYPAGKRADWHKMSVSATYGIHDKIATPLLCLPLILIAAPLGIRPQRSSGGVSLGLSLMILLGYYVVWTWATKVGKSGIADPYILAYLPLGLATIAGMILTYQKSR